MYAMDRLTEDEKDRLKKCFEELVENDTWMSDVKDCLEESMENEPDTPEELVQIFESEWNRTGHYHVNVYEPIFKILKEKEYNEVKYPLLQMAEDMMVIAAELFWEPFHKKHKTHEKARKIML